MSALPPKADMCGAARDVRFGPKADIRWLTADMMAASDDLTYSSLTPIASMTELQS